MTENGTSAASNIKVKIINSVEVPILTRCCFCIPLRKGLITLAYINLVVTGLVIPLFAISMFTQVPMNNDLSWQISENLMPQLAIELALLVVEFVMTLVFIVGLHMKKVKIMRIYLYFGIFYLIVSTLYTIVLAFVSRETVTDILMVFSQLLIQLYFLIVTWSSIVKMTRDGSVKYTRSEDINNSVIYT